MGDSVSIQRRAHRLRYIKSIGLVSPDARRRENNTSLDPTSNATVRHWIIEAQNKIQINKINYEWKNAAIADASSNPEGNITVLHIS